MRMKYLELSLGTKGVQIYEKSGVIERVEGKNITKWGQFGCITVHYLKLFIITAWSIYRTEH